MEAYLQGYKDALAVIRIAVDIKVPTKEEMLEMIAEKMNAKVELEKE